MQLFDAMQILSKIQQTSSFILAAVHNCIKNTLELLHAFDLDCRNNYCLLQNIRTIIIS